MGCGGLSERLRESPEPEATAKAVQLMERIRGRNNHLRTFKGIGRMEWLYNGSVQHARLAWVGAVPDKIRLEVLDLAGRPALSLSSDGTQLYFFSHPENRFEKTSAADVDLETLISIAIPIRDIIQLLTGRLPLPAHPTRETIATDSKDELSLIVDSGWFGQRQKIFLDPTHMTVDACEIFNAFGSLVYRAELAGHHPIREFTIPASITLSGENGAVFRLRVDRYWANIAVSPSVFTLEPPEQ